jgi:hypothetical protein
MSLRRRRRKAGRCEWMTGEGLCGQGAKDVTAGEMSGLRRTARDVASDCYNGIGWSGVGE